METVRRQPSERQLQCWDVFPPCSWLQTVSSLLQGSLVSWILMAAWICYSGIPSHRACWWPFLPCSLIHKAFCSPTWLQELASQHLCILMPLSCHPRGLQSILPFIAVVFINQGTKTGMSAQWLQLFLVSWGAWAGLLWCHLFIPRAPHSRRTVLPFLWFSFAR